MLVFEQRCFTTEKRKLLKKYSVYMCIMFYSFRFQKMTKNRIQVLVFISPFFSWSFLASLLQLFLDNLRIYELLHFFNIICIKTTSQWFVMLFSYFGTMMGELRTQNGTHARLQWISKKQLKVVNSTSFYSFQGGLISV